MEELLLDYEDYLRQRGKRQWDKSDREALAVRTVGKQHQTDQADQADWADPVAHWKAYARWLEHADPAVVANALICLIHQTNYLLDQQISALERDFVQEGGYSEQLAAARIAERQKQQQHSATPAPAAPACPQCGKPMALRTARKGQRAGSQFWGCAGYPDCRGTRPLEASDGSDRSDRAKRGKS